MGTRQTRVEDESDIHQWSSSLYEDRLNKLVYGHNNKLIDVPDDVSNCIINFIFSSEHNKIMLQTVVSSLLRIEIEIFMDEFIAKVIDYSSIKQYQIESKFTPKAELPNFLGNYCFLRNCAMETIPSQRIYQDGISFIYIPFPLMYKSYSLQVTAIDNDDNIMMTSEWLKIGKQDPSFSQTFNGTATTTNTYFDKFVDVNNRGSVGIHEWISF